MPFYRNPPYSIRKHSRRFKISVLCVSGKGCECRKPEVPCGYRAAPFCFDPFQETVDCFKIEILKHDFSGIFLFT